MNAESDSGAEQSEIYRTERSRTWTEAELVSAASAAILLASVFVLDWYGVVGLPRGADRSAIDSAVNGWRELDGIRWLIVLTAAIAIGAVILHATQRSHGTTTNTGLIVTALGTLTAVLLANRVLLNLPAPSTVVDVKLGGFIGLLAAIGIAIGGYQTLRDERETIGLRRRPAPASSEAGRLRSQSAPR